MHECIWTQPGRDKSAARHRHAPQAQVFANGNAPIRPDVFYGASRPHRACLWIPVE